ncbi:MAG TPA: DUF4336 domain-containing protein [Noviherbaspirillum sp.]
MLYSIDKDIWHAQHNFLANGLPVSSRMSIIRLESGGLWLHSPIPISDQMREQLAALGEVKFIVAPSKTHHLFVSDCVSAYPQARLFGARGLPAKRPDLKSMTALGSAVEPEWEDNFVQIFFDGIPFGNETVWFHKPSQTLILTDLCQWWQGELPFTAKIYAYLTGVRKELAVPRTVRWLVKDRQAARTSAQRILELPVKRVIMAHNAIIEKDAHSTLAKALAYFLK